MKHITSKISLIIFTTYLALCFFPQLITPFSPDQSDASQILNTPNSIHWLGSDELGRDLLSRILQASKYSLLIALSATAICSLIGLFMGALSALGGKVIDAVLMRLMDLFLGIPDLLIYIILGIFLGQNPTGLIISLSLFGWISLARLVRFSIQEEMGKEYLLAAQTLGLSKPRILLRHILPNIKQVYLKAITLKIPSFILAESTLSFLGLGLKSPLASLGTLAAEGYGALKFYPHLAIMPLVVMVLIMTSLNTHSQKKSGKYF